MSLSHTKRITKSDIRDRIGDRYMSLEYYINPDDIDDHAEDWSDIDQEVLTHKIHQMTDHALTFDGSGYNSVVRSVVYDISINDWLDGMPRIHKRHLIYDTNQEALENDIWPDRCSYQEAQTHLMERWPTIHDLPSEAFQEGRERVSAVLYELLLPAGVEP